MFDVQCISSQWIRKSLACQPQSWRISAYLASGFIDLPLHKAMMHVVGDKAWQWIPVGSFSWEAFFKDDWGQNNLLEWCEWGIAVLSRIEHSPGASTWELSSNSFLLHLTALDPDRRHWKKQTLKGKDFSRPVWDILPSHSQPTLEHVEIIGLETWSVDNQLTSRSRLQSSNSF